MASPNEEAQKTGTEWYKDFYSRAGGLFTLGAILVVASAVIIFGIDALRNASETARMNAQAARSPEAQQARYLEALASQRWFFCDNYSVIDCAGRGVRIVSLEPLRFQETFYERNSVERRVVTYALEEDCPGSWITYDESGEFCLEKRSDELYVGWINNSGYINSLCLAYGRDSRNQEFDDAPIDCALHFDAVGPAQAHLSSNK